MINPLEKAGAVNMQPGHAHLWEAPWQGEPEPNRRGGPEVGLLPLTADRGVDWRKGTRGWDDWVVLGGKHGVGVVVRDLSTSRLHPC
jgi:hypothetical protein